MCVCVCVMVAAVVCGKAVGIRFLNIEKGRMKGWKSEVKVYIVLCRVFMGARLDMFSLLTHHCRNSAAC